MKAICIIVLGIGLAWTFFALLFWTLEEYSRSQTSIWYILAGLAVVFLGLICLKRRS